MAIYWYNIEIIIDIEIDKILGLIGFAKTLGFICDQFFLSKPNTASNKTILSLLLPSFTLGVDKPHFFKSSQA